MNFVSKDEYKALKAKAAARKLKREAKRPGLWAKSTPDRARASKAIQKTPRPLGGRKTLVKRLDAVFSLYIRMRDRKVAGGMCVLCLKRPIQVCFHWVSRGSFATRWSADNAVGSCKGCNFEEHFKKQKYRDLHIARTSKQFREDLEARARKLTHFTNPELEDMIKFFKLKFEEGL